MSNDPSPPAPDLAALEALASAAPAGVRLSVKNHPGYAAFYEGAIQVGSVFRYPGCAALAEFLAALDASTVLALCAEVRQLRTELTEARRQVEALGEILNRQRDEDMSDSGRVIGETNPHHPNFQGDRLAALEAENAQLRAELAEARQRCEGLAERVSQQSELLSRKAERPVWRDDVRGS